MSNPSIKYSLAKYLDKGEDAWTQQPAADLALDDLQEPIKAAFFGVFDGHGGKAAASFASRGLLARLQAALKSSAIEPNGSEENGSIVSGQQDRFNDATSQTLSSSASVESQSDNLTNAEAHSSQSHSLSKATAEDAEVTKLKLQALEVGMDDDDIKLHDRTDDLVKALPTALVTAFDNTQADFFTHSKTSGSTATVLIVSGWQVIVASVGDSLAYLDTGSEVIQVSGNHRLDDSLAERSRILAAGAEVAQSEVDGRGVGPLRVWPGGLAMGRTLGDHSGGDSVLCLPEIRQVTLPQSGGRVIVASDGLWDLLSPKTAAHHVRGLPASKAASELVSLAARNSKPRDDITVIVVDALPPGSEKARYPPLLDRSKGNHSMAPGSTAQPADLYWPLDHEGAAQWRQTAWVRRVAAAVESHERALQAKASAAKPTAAAAAAAESVANAESTSSKSHVTTSEDSGGEVQYASELHRQMALLQLDPSEYEAQSCARQSEPDIEGETSPIEGGWEIVESKAGQHDDRKGSRPHNIESRDNEQQSQGRSWSRGRTGGDSTSINSGRGRGRRQGRDRESQEFQKRNRKQQQHQHQQQQQQQKRNEVLNDGSGELIHAYHQDAESSDCNLRVSNGMPGDAQLDAADTTPTSAGLLPSHNNGIRTNVVHRGGRGGRHDGRMAGYGRQGSIDRVYEDAERGGRGRGRGRGRSASQSQQRQQQQQQQQQQQPRRQQDAPEQQQLRYNDDHMMHPDKTQAAAGAAGADEPQQVQMNGRRGQTERRARKDARKDAVSQQDDPSIKQPAAPRQPRQQQQQLVPLQAGRSTDITTEESTIPPIKPSQQQQQRQRQQQQHHQSQQRQPEQQQQQRQPEQPQQQQPPRQQEQQQQQQPFIKTPFRMPERSKSSQVHSQQPSQRQHPAIAVAQQQPQHQPSATGNVSAIVGCVIEHSTDNVFNTAHVSSKERPSYHHHQQQQQQEQHGHRNLDRHDPVSQQLRLPALQFGSFDYLSQAMPLPGARASLRFGSFGDDILASGPPQASQHPPLNTAPYDSNGSVEHSAPAASTTRHSTNAPGATCITAVQDAAPSSAGNPSTINRHGNRIAANSRSQQPPRRSYGVRGPKAGRAQGVVSQQRQQEHQQQRQPSAAVS